MTSPADKIPDHIVPKNALEADRPITQPQSTFESYMQGTANPAQTAPPTTAAGPQGVTPMQLPAQGAMGTPTFDSLMNQAKNAQDGLGTVGKQLQDSTLKLKRSQTHLLKNKLQDSNEYIRAAGNKLGVEKPPLELPSGGSPIARFLGYISDGQDNLAAVQSQLQGMAQDSGSINPADMFLVQIKLNQAQQEIEFSSTLLSKVIESIKTLLNVQL